MQKVVQKTSEALLGEIEIPSDKSISHRAIMLASLAKGKSVIKNFSDGQDPKSTLDIFSKLGVEFEVSGNNVIVKSTGYLMPASEPLYCGNSGTTMRLISGILARQSFDSVLTGDKSLSNRPMKRIIDPLTIMGANIVSDNFKAPLKIAQSELHSISYNSQISSAQVKSCILLAGLGVTDDGTTTYIEPYLSRNHTEKMLKHMGADIITENSTVRIKKSQLSPIEIEICGDISSAAFFIVGASLIPNSKIIIKNIGLNPTRTGIIEVLKKNGCKY